MTAVHADTLISGFAAVPVAVAARDPGPVFTAAAVGAFTGRAWLADEVDQFIAGHPCGYVFVEADAGIGKTAFAAWLVKTRGYLSHFSRYSGGRSVQGALQNLAAQLIRSFGLDDQAPGGMLPAWAQAPAGFESLLGAAAGVAARRAQRLVIVVDGLDEALAEPEASGDQLSFGLPTLLPAGVYVIGTHRTGHWPGRPESPSLTVPVGRDDPRNRADIAAFLAGAAAEEVMAARLAAAQVDAEEFTALLARRCGGVWVYLRYVLQELRLGLRQPGTISGLPDGLRAYYASQVRRWHDDPAWDSELSPLLATLGVAGEPLPVHVLARLAGLNATVARRRCDLALRPLLNTIYGGRGEPALYEVYHASFRDVLKAQHQPGQPVGGPYELVALAGELREATRAAHSRVADVYLDGFGGLDGGLPALAAAPGIAGADGGYPLRHLARHLHHAGRVADLRRLLAAECLAADGRAANVWFAAHDHAHCVLAYLEDLARARSISTEETTRALAGGRAAPSLGMEIGYALMAAAIVSRSANVPQSLLERLLSTGTWSPAQGLDHARRVARPAQRAHALIVVSRHAGIADQPAIIAEAIAAAADITGDHDSAQALAALAPHLPGDLLAQAVDAATAIDGFRGSELLAALAPYLPEDLLTRAFTASNNEYSLPGALPALMPHLPEEKRTDLVNQALATIAAMAGDGNRIRALAALVPHLPEKQRTDVLSQALAAAATLAHNGYYVPELGALAPHLPEPLLAQALAMAAAMANDGGRADALATLVPHLPEEQRTEVLSQALAAAAAITDNDSRARALGALAPHLPEEQRTDVLTQALAVASSGSPRWALAALAPHLPENLLAQALAATSTGDDEASAYELAWLGPHLPESLLGQAMVVATAISNDDHRAWALGALAPHLPENLLAQALAAATVKDDSARIGALTALAPHLPEGQRTEVLAQALAAAEEEETPYYFDYFADTLAALASSLPESLLAQAVDAAIFLDSHDRAKAFAALAPHLPEDLLGEALNVASLSSYSDYRRGEALAALAPYLPGHLLAQALDDAAATGYSFADALGALAPHLPEPLLAQACTAATATTSEYYRFEALTALAPHLPEGQRADVLAQALATATALDSDEARISALAGLAPHLPEGQQADALAQALAAATALADDGTYPRALIALAPHLPERLLAQALAAATHGRFHSEVVAALAPRLPEDLLGQALTAASTVTDSYFRDEALAGLTPHLPRAMLTQVLALVPDANVEIIRALMERCQDVLAKVADEELLSALRSVIRGMDLKTCLVVTAVTAPTISRIGGTGGAQECVRAITDVHRWWASPGRVHVARPL